MGSIFYFLTIEEPPEEPSRAQAVGEPGLKGEKFFNLGFKFLLGLSTGKAQV